MVVVFVTFYVNAVVPIISDIVSQYCSVRVKQLDIPPAMNLLESVFFVWGKQESLNDECSNVSTFVRVSAGVGNHLQ